MPSFLPGTTCLNFVVLFLPVVLCFTIYFLTLGWSLLGDKPVAHALAREATSLASPATYYDISTFIETLIINEMLQAHFSKKKKQSKVSKPRN